MADCESQQMEGRGRGQGQWAGLIYLCDVYTSSWSHVQQNRYMCVTLSDFFTWTFHGNIYTKNICGRILSATKGR